MADRGLYGKYDVWKRGTDELIEDAFVLRPEKDLVARDALRVYAEKTPNETLANDLWGWLDLIENPRVVKRDWNPQPPDMTCGCGQLMTQMAAYDDSDQYSLFWDCPDLCGYADDYPPIDWPFEQDVARPEDLIGVGFKIV